LHQQLIEEATLHRDLSVNRQLDAHPPPADRDELYASQLPMWQRADTLLDSQPPEHRPAARVQAIAADFLARKGLAFEQDDAQTSFRTERRARRAGRPAAHNCDVKHRASESEQASK
jgi:hypothetical protein